MWNVLSLGISHRIGGIRHIAPKLSEVGKALAASVLGMVDDRVEIQMLTENLQQSCENCMEVVENLLKTKKLTIVVLHLPFGKHDLLPYFINNAEMSELLELFKQIATWQQKFNASGHTIQFAILLHHPTSMEIWNKIPNVSLRLQTILSTCRTAGIKLFLENSPPDLGTRDRHDILKYPLLEQYGYLEGVYDVCHANITYHTLERLVATQAIPKISWIHFAACLGTDGVRDKKTHGRRHESKAALAEELTDLIVYGFDLDNVTLCLEIGEEDYANRPDQVQEYEWLCEILG